MKRLDLIKAIEAGGCVLVRHGGRYDWYRNPVTGVSSSRVREPLIAVVVGDITPRTDASRPKRRHA